MSRFATVPAFLLSLAITPAALLATAPPGDGPVLVIAPPWADAAGVVAAAGGRPSGPLRAPFALLARFPTPAAARAARAHGAWAVIDGAAFAALCGMTDA